MIFRNKERQLLGLQRAAANLNDLSKVDTHRARPSNQRGSVRRRLFNSPMAPKPSRVRLAGSGTAAAAALAWPRSKASAKLAPYLAAIRAGETGGSLESKVKANSS